MGEMQDQPAREAYPIEKINLIGKIHSELGEHLSALEDRLGIVLVEAKSIPSDSVPVGQVAELQQRLKGEGDPKGDSTGSSVLCIKLDGLKSQAECLLSHVTRILGRLDI